MRIPTATFTLCSLWILVSCQKNEYCEPPPKSSNCNLVQSIDNNLERSEYRKEYGSDGRVSRVLAGIFTLGYVVDSVMLHLHYYDATVYLLDDTNERDTLLIATFDAHHRLQKMVVGNVNTQDAEFNSMECLYTGGRLSGIASSGRLNVVLHFWYDANGNVVRRYLEGWPETGGVFYTYDLSVTAKRQWYSHFTDTNADNT